VVTKYFWWYILKTQKSIAIRHVKTGPFENEQKCSVRSWCMHLLDTYKIRSGRQRVIVDGRECKGWRSDQTTTRVGTSGEIVGRKRAGSRVGQQYFVSLSSTPRRVPGATSAWPTPIIIIIITIVIPMLQVPPPQRATKVKAIFFRPEIVYKYPWGTQPINTALSIDSPSTSNYGRAIPI